MLVLPRLLAANGSLNTQKDPKDQEAGFQHTHHSWTDGCAFCSPWSYWTVILVMATCLALALESKVSSVTNKLLGLGFQLPDLQYPHPRQDGLDGSCDLPNSMILVKFALKSV